MRDCERLRQRQHAIIWTDSRVEERTGNAAGKIAQMKGKRIGGYEQKGKKDEEEREQEEEVPEGGRAERGTRLFRVEKGDLRKSPFSTRKRRFARARWFHVLVIINVIFDYETSHQTFENI